MKTHELSYLFALAAALSFSLSSIVMTNFSRRMSPIWMNTMKCGLAFVAFFIVIQFGRGWHTIENLSLYALIASGVIGLGIGDIFLLNGFAKIGPARTLMLFGFSPIITGLIGFFFFDQTMTLSKLTAIFFMLLCLFLFSLESFKKKGTWGVHGLIFALIGVLLDGIGIGFTRYAFNTSPEVSPVEANFYRCFGALIVFFVTSRVKPIGLWRHFKPLVRKDRILVLAGGLGGTFLSLWFFLSAVQIGHLASVSAIGVTSPFFATLFERVFYGEKPSLYLLWAGISFVCGFLILWL